MIAREVDLEAFDLNARDFEELEARYVFSIRSMQLFPESIHSGGGKGGKGGRSKAKPASKPKGRSGRPSSGDFQRREFESLEARYAAVHEDELD